LGITKINQRTVDMAKPARNMETRQKTNLEKFLNTNVLGRRVLQKLHISFNLSL